MPLVTTLIDDKSPLILYDASWAPGNSADDPFADAYYLGTFTTNNITDGQATFYFNGTAFWIYGAKRPNHGSYTVEVDGNSFAGSNGEGNNLFQQSLFNTSGLTQGMHTVILTNTATGSLYVDIDMIVWQSEVGNDGDQLLSETVQDTDPRFQYQEPAWSTSANGLNFNLFSNGSGHSTETYEANTEAFPEAVTLFGATGPSNGPYTVQVDGGQANKYNATSFMANYGVALFHADNLGPGQHQMVVTNLPDTNGQSLSIDYATLMTLSSSSTTSGSGSGSSSGSGSGSGAPTSNLSTSPNQLSSGAIAGIVVAVVAAVLAAGAAFFFYRRWKAALATQNDLYRIYTPQHHPDTTIATTNTSAISTSLETRSNASMLRNDTTSQVAPGRLYQQPDYGYQGGQYTGHTRIISGSDSAGPTENTETVSSPTHSSVDEAYARRPLPAAPGGGLSLDTELPKLAGRRSVQTVNRSSVAMSELPPPNYIQATGS
ncbi:hypothetical protein HYDPIDRAFT_25166 [Hydnomerulius pinastri MD-312]|nr:hypothetical protein HYDPIDRAFT_25166 [Hydnomerulius pinastri MD-312]